MVTWCIQLVFSHKEMECYFITIQISQGGIRVHTYVLTLALRMGGISQSSQLDARIYYLRLLRFSPHNARILRALRRLLIFKLPSGCNSGRASLVRLVAEFL